MVDLVSEMEITFNGCLNFDYIIPFLVVTFVMVIFIAVGVTTLVKKITRNKILKQGIKATARFINYKEGKVITKTVNNRVTTVRQYYKVEYEYRNSKGEITTNVSDDSYTIEDINRFKSAKYFEISVLGDDAEIISVPTSSQIAKYSHFADSKFCSYCGTKVSNSSKKCPSCGSAQFDDVI